MDFVRVLGASLLVCGMVGLQAAPAQAAKTAKKARTVRSNGDNAALEAAKSELKAQADTYLDLFKKGDAHGLSQMWTPNGSMICTDGRILSGQKEIEKDFAALFAHTGPREMEALRSLKVQQESLQLVAPDVVLERGTNIIGFAPDQPTVKTRYMAVQKKIDGKWLMESLVETNIDESPIKLDDLAFLIGQWKASGENGQKEVTLNGRWQAHHHFLIVEFDYKDGEKHEREMLINTFDPRFGTITSWIFDSQGGFGRAIWTKVAGGWQMKAIRTEPSGSIVHTRNMIGINSASDRKLTWQALERRVDDVDLGGTAKIEVDKVSDTPAVPFFATEQQGR
ncbi:MAG: nuclear transport factor 2 family protein [Candidatus Melainabacteria bacterium]|jgi:uncharacterized protein (TIGR02246 family)|nr:nuclear transport factor 2 family protein [Candidatus Melainabacteria bacterium]MBX9672127.1 nuclear transport factor 2 family protein [Candidatus Obscuribacterales bacterium]